MSTLLLPNAGAHQLLDEERLLVGAPRRGDAADRAAAVLGLDALEPAGGVADRLVPRDLAPRVVIVSRTIGLSDAVLVGGVALGEPALDAVVALVGLAVLVRHHPDDRSSPCTSALNEQPTPQ